MSYYRIGDYLALCANSKDCEEEPCEKGEQTHALYGDANNYF